MAFFTTALFIKLGVAAALSVASTLLRPKPKKPSADSLDFSQTVSTQLDFDLPKEVLVGQRQTGGILVYRDTHGVNKEYRVVVKVLSSQPCTEYVSTTFKTDTVTLSGDPTLGQVDVTSHYLGKDDEPRTTVRIFLGDDNSGLGAYLSSVTEGAYSASDIASESCVAIIIYRLTNDDYDEDTGEFLSPFASAGEPDASFELKGVRVCDPEISGASYQDKTTHIYSDNPALIAAHFDYGWRAGSDNKVIVGNGYDAAQIPDVETIANKNYCLSRGYTCSGRVRSQNQGDYAEILKTFNAVRVRTGGVVYALPEGRRPAPITIDMSEQGNLAARVTKANRQGFSPEVFNGIRTIYAEPQELYSQKDLPFRNDPDFLTQDNGVIRETSLSLLFCTNVDQAIDLENEEILGGRAAASLQVSGLPPKYGSNNVLKEGGLVTIINSQVAWANDKTFYVVSKVRSSDLDISLSLRQYAGDEAYQGVAVEERPSVTINPVLPKTWTTRTDTLVPESLLNTLASQSLSGSYVSGITISSALDGSNASITVSAHTRVYGDARSVSVVGNSFTGLANDTLYYISYIDEDLDGEPSSWTIGVSPSSSVPSSTFPFRHHVGSFRTVAVDGTGGGGATSTPSSFPPSDDPDYDYP